MGKVPIRVSLNQKWGLYFKIKTYGNEGPWSILLTSLQIRKGNIKVKHNKKDLLDS